MYRLESFGVPYQVEIERRGASQALADSALRAVLPPFTKRRLNGEPGRTYRFSYAGRRRMLLVESDAPIACPTQRSAQDAFEGDLALHVASACPDRVFIHAGVVAWKGRAILLPGRTFAGKSTLVAELIAAGATYYSDEYAVIDTHGLVSPYPRRLSLRRAGGLPRRTMPRRVGRKRIPVGWVLGARYALEAALEVELLSAGRTALVLLDNAVAARIASGRVLAAVCAVASHCRGALVVRGEAKGAVKDLLPLLSRQGILPSGRLKSKGIPCL